MGDGKEITLMFAISGNNYSFPKKAVFKAVSFINGKGRKFTTGCEFAW
jgi:hypothetical protein